jgi:Ca2+-binding RTX toxin-like protein
VVFGSREAFAATLNLAALDGPNGFQINGEGRYDRSGWSVSAAGDVNGDGIDDLIIGAYHPDPYDFNFYTGRSYIVFGKRTPFAATLELSELTGGSGFKIIGEAADDWSGRSVSAAGDINGDGIDDVIIGSLFADPNGSKSGASYVVFGSRAAAGNLNLSALTGSNGFQISGEVADDWSGWAVRAAGDINGDGIDDMIIGAVVADPNGASSGASYVVFGSRTPFAATLELSALTGSNGFQISGEAAGDLSGYSVSAAGDINGDGIDDLIIGARGADPNGSGSGASYVVFGSRTEFAANLNLSALTGSNGFQISGEVADDWSGFSVSAAGDFNGDGIDDLIIGAPYADPYDSKSGASYVVFGQSVAPVQSSIEAGFLPYAPGAAGIQITSSLNVNDPKGFVLTGATVQISAGFQSGDVLEFTNIGNITGVYNGNGTLTLSGTDTAAAYQAALRSVKYSSSNLSPLERTVSFQVKDSLLLSNVVTRKIGGTTQLVGTTLNVYGTPSADIITVSSVATLKIVANGMTFKYTPASVTAVKIFGYAGNDSITVSSLGTGTSLTADGGNDNDTLTVSNSVTLNTTLLGGAGNDTLTGGRGSDTLNGGEGNDTYVFRAAATAEADVVSELLNQGTDTLSFSSLTTSVNLNVGASVVQSVHTNRTLKLNSGSTFENTVGGSGDDILTGNGLANGLTGGAGHDRLTGHAGNDVLIGGFGNDTYVFGVATASEADTVTEAANAGTDTLTFSSLTTSVTLNLGTAVVQSVHTNRTLKLNSGNTFENAVGGSGNDTLLGNSLANTLNGNNGHDILVGNAGNDQLLGGAGRDILIGGLDQDVLNGGSDDDILIAGRTTNDASIINLSILRTEWIQATPYATRVANLRAGVGTPITSLKATINVLNDATGNDSLTGGSGQDWYFRAIDDVITDLLTGELIDQL